MALSILIQNQNMFWRLYMYFSFSFFRGSVTDGKMINGRICLWVQQRIFCKSKCWDADLFRKQIKHNLWNEPTLTYCHASFELPGFVALSSDFLHAPAPPRVPIEVPESKNIPWKQNFKECKKDLWQCSPIGKGTTRLSKDASITASLFDEQLKLVVFARHPSLPPSTFFKLGEIYWRWNGTELQNVK